MNKLWIALVAVLGLAVAGFAFAGPGLMAGLNFGGFGGMHPRAFGNHSGNWTANATGNFSNWTDADKAALLSAQSDGNYDAALALLQAHGFSGTLDRAAFDRRAQLIRAIEDKNWSQVVALQTQAKNERAAQMMQKRDEMKQKMQDWMAAHPNMRANVHAFVKGMRGQPQPA